MLFLLRFAVALFLSSSIRAQDSLRPSDCIGKIDSFPNCDAVTANLARCNSLTNKNAIISCFCTQSFITSWIGCKSETRQCGLTTSFDSKFDSFLVEWHGTCDAHLSAAITTPPVTQPTATVQQGDCASVAENCNRWSRGAATCRVSSSIGPGVTSCLCSRSMVSLASACEIDGSRLCLFSSADVTQLWEYQNCPGGSRLFSDTLVTTRTAATVTIRTATVPLLPTATLFDTPRFGQPTTQGSTTSSISQAESTAKRPMLCLLLLRVIALVQVVPLNGLRII